MGRVKGRFFIFFLRPLVRFFGFGNRSSRIKFYQAHPVTSVLQTTMVSVFFTTTNSTFLLPRPALIHQTHVIMNVMDWCHSLLCHGQHQSKFMYRQRNVFFLYFHDGKKWNSCVSSCILSGLFSLRVDLGLTELKSLIVMARCSLSLVCVLSYLCEVWTTGRNAGLSPFPLRVVPD